MMREMARRHVEELRRVAQGVGAEAHGGCPRSRRSSVHESASTPTPTLAPGTNP
uniref:Uncharacterized protein n=1 Tax=Setaria italica TaxID=4555 RepID=K3YNU1_SETIT